MGSSEGDLNGFGDFNGCVEHSTSCREGSSSEGISGISSTAGTKVHVGIQQSTTYIFQGLCNIDFSDLSFTFQYLE